MTAYKQFITAVGKLLGGDDEMKKRAEEIVAFETKLAKVKNAYDSLLFQSLQITTLRDPTVASPISDNPKCQTKMAAHGKWSLTRASTITGQYFPIRIW